MHRVIAHSALLLAFACIAESYVEIPERLKNGKMSQYPACRALFSQTEESYAVVEEDMRGPFGKICNCSFSRNPPQSGLSIQCQITREVVVPIALTFYQHLTNVAYFIIRYRRKESSDPWKEKRVEFSQGSPPVAQIDFDYRNGVTYIYIVQIYGVLSDNSRLLLHTDEISSATGASVISANPAIYPTETTEYHRQVTLNFNMDFNEITDNTIKIFFQTDNKESFRVAYIRNGRESIITLDDGGRATLQGLQPETQYTFIVYYLQNGEWKELKRHTVRTLPEQRIVIQNQNRPVVPSRQVTILECPIVQDVEVEAISWYRILENQEKQLIATFTEETGETVYPLERDPNFEVREGRILAIKNAGPEYDGLYRCRISILGADFQQYQQWPSVRIAERVRAFVSWRSAPGVLTYYVQYRPQTDVSGGWKYVIIDSQSNAVIGGLQPLTTYLFEVYDYTGNIKGRLVDSVTVKTTTSGQEELNFCQSEPCLNNGVCHDISNGYQCQCRGGFTGPNCERATTPCNPNPCENGGVCRSGIGGGYDCTCRSGFTGSHCGTVAPRNPCESNPCSHGHCSVLGGNYNCECERQYHGRNCDQRDTGSSFLLQCPIKEEYGTPVMIRWYRLEGQRRSPISTFDVALHVGQTDNSRYAGRLSSPSYSDLIIHDATAADIGTYQCVVSYQHRQDSSPAMQLFQVPSDDTRIAVTWTPSSLYIDHYKVNYRNIDGDDEPVEVQIPPDSTRHTLNNLEPGGTYEIYVIPYTRSGVAAPLSTIQSISPDAPTTTTAMSTTTRNPPSRGDIPVNVIPTRRGPYSIGSRVILSCAFRRLEGSLSIIWKKDGNIITPEIAGDRIVGFDRSLLQIPKFEESDAGTYTCNVEYISQTSITVGQGSSIVAVAKEIPPPSNLQIDVTGPQTTVLRWQSPRNTAVTGYNVIYYPSGQTYSKQFRQVNVPTISLTNLKEGTEYVVEILAYTDQRFSAPLEQNFMQELETIPEPSDYRFTALSDTEARIFWDQVDRSGITGYKIQYWDVTRTASPPNLVTKETTSMNVILNNLVNGKTYQVAVRAKKGDKLSAPLSRQFTKTAPIKPNPPSSVSFKDVGSDEVTVSWVTPEGWTPNTKYRVRVQSRDESNPLSITYPDSAPNTRMLTSLTPGVPYYVTIQSVVDGVLSNPIYGIVKTVDIVKLSAPYPDSVTLQCKTQSSAYVYQVQWFKITPSEEENLIYIAFPPSSGAQSRHSSSDTQFIGRLSAPTVMELQVINISYPVDFGKYKCKALSSGSRDTNVIDVVAKYPDRIAAPYKFKHTPLNSTAARISWQHPYGEDISSYTVTYRPTVAFLGPEKTIEVYGTSVVLNDLIPGTDYTAVVKSRIVNRQSDDSLLATFINFGDQVRNVQVTRMLDRNDLEITWDNPPGNEGVIFAVRRSDDDTWNDQPITSGDTSSKRIRYPLNQGESVQFRISSVKNNVAAPFIVKYTEQGSPFTGVERTPAYPEPVDTTHQPTVTVMKPSPVMNLRLESGTPERLSISFDDTPVEDYDYYSIKISNLGAGIVESFNTTQPYLEVILEPGETYEVSVSTVLDGFASPPVTKTISLSPEIEPTPPPLEPVSPPTNLRFSSVMRSRLTVLWDSDDDSVTDFEVRYRPYDADEEWKTVRTSNYQVTIRGLAYDTEYIVRVVAINVLGSSEPVEKRVRTQTGGRVSLRRPRVRIIARTNDSFTLRFGDSTTSYRVETVLVGSEDNAQTTVVPFGEDTVQLTGLGAGKHYRISAVRVANGRVGKAFRIRATTNPNQPVHLVTSDTQPNSVTLTWDEPESDEITGYRVIYSPVSTNIIQTMDTATNTVNLTNLEPNTQYNIRVQSKQGNEISLPTELSVTTAPDTDIQPVQTVRFSDVSANSAVIEWTPPLTRALYNYEVKLRPADDVDGWFPTSTTQENWVLFEGLNPATEYVAEVTSVLGDKKSEPVSTTVTTNVPITTAVEVPRSPDGGQPVKVTWDIIENAEGYNVTYFPVDGSPQFVTVDGSANSVVLDGLQPETEYIVHVTAFMNGVEGLPHKVTLVTGPVAKPDNIEFQPSDGTMQIIWDDVNADQYEVTYHPVGDSRYPVTELVTSPYYKITNVEPGEYEITVTAIKSGHRSPSTTTVQSIGVKSPDEITFTDETENGFVIMWEPSTTSGVVNYVVRVKPADDLTGDFEELLTEETFMTVTDLEPGTTYVVQVLASTFDQDSEPVTTTVSTGVASPKLVTTTLGEDDGSVTVNWQPVPDAFSYQVTYYPIDSSESLITIVDGSENQTVLHGLQPGTEYVVEVTSLINDIESEPVKNRVVTPLEKPKKIEGMDKGDSASSDSVRITWETENAAPVYEIRYFPVYETGDEVVYGKAHTVNVPGSNGGTVLSDLAPATKYIVEVVATDGIKTSRPQRVTVTTSLDQPEVVQDEPGENEVTLRWQPSDGVVTEYRIDLVPSDGSPTITVPVDGTRNSVTVNGLQPGTEYEVHITAINNDLKVESAPVISRVETKPADVRPVNTNIRKLPNDTYVITWSRPASPVSYYIVHYRATDGTPSENTIQVLPDETSVMLPPLVPNTEYRIQIQGVSNPGDAKAEHNTVEKTVTTDVPSMSGPLTISTVTDDYVELVWDSPVNKKYLSGYRVEFYPTGSQVLTNSVEEPRSANMASTRGLEPNTNYTVRVTPHINLRPGKPVSTTFVTDHPRVVPSPESVEADERDTDSVVIRWERPVDYDSITSYEVLVEQDNGEIFSYEIDGSANEFTIPDLTPGTTYDVTLISFVEDREGQEVKTRLSTLPESPDQVVINGVHSDSLQVTWRPDQNADSYTVTVLPLNNPLAETKTYDTEDTRVHVTDLLPDTTYRVEVAALTPDGEQSNPTVTEIKTLPGTVDIVPDIQPEGSITFSPQQPDVLISWEPLTDVPVDAYQIFFSAPGEPTRTVTVPSFANEAILSSLEPEKEYNVWVVGVLPFGENAPVPGISHHTVTIIPPDNYEPLTDESIIAPDDGKISITWEPLGPDVTVYGVNYTNLVTGDNYQTVVPGTFTGTLLSGLYPGDNYIIEVKGVKNGVPVQVDNVNVGTSDFIVDENSIQAISPTGRFELQWFQDSQDEDRIIGYTVIYERKCCLGEPDMIWVPAPNRSTVLNLEPNTEYVFRVEGKTSDGLQIPIPDIISQSIPDSTAQPFNPTDNDMVRPTNPIATRPRPSPATSTRSQPMHNTQRPVSTTSSTTPATRERKTEPTPTFPGLTDSTDRTVSIATRSTPIAVTRSTPPRLDPLGNTERTQTTRGIVQPTTSPSGGRTNRVTPTPGTAETTLTPQETPGVEALPTLDGNILISWTPTEEPDEYILEYYPRDGSSPGRRITIPGDVRWSSIPEPTNQLGYVMTIYTVTDGVTKPLYDIQLRRSPTTGGFTLSYKPSGIGNRHATISESMTTHEIVIPSGEGGGTLSESEYTFNPSGDVGLTDEEYTHWLTPISRPVGNSRTVVLRWNPEQTNITETVERLRLELVPINNTNAKTIYTYLPSRGVGNIPGLLPGVSYQLFARYMRNGRYHRAGDIATQFVIPAFTSQGTLERRQFGSTDVWMKELRSGNLLLQWKNYPGAKSYTIEDRELPDGLLHTSTKSINNRWIVLPQLQPGGVYSINIYATVSGRRIKIYTVTVTRKITGPLPPSKIEWYNMYGDSVDLAWIPPTTEITGYMITYRLDEEGSKVFVSNLSADARTFHMSNLQPGKAYRVTIQTVRGEHISRAFTFTLQMNIPTVRRLFFRQTGPDTIVVNWPALPDYVTGYMIQVKQTSPQGPDLVGADILEPEQTEYTIEGIRPSYRYEFIIRTLVDDAESDPVTLQLWTLRQESQVSRIQETGRWTVTWSGQPYEVDYWKMEVRRSGDQTILQVRDNIDPSITSVDFDDLPLGVEYVVSIYGVKDSVVSTPIKVVIPAHPQTETQRGRPSIPAIGRQLVKRIKVQRSAESIQLFLYPVDDVDRYDIQYKTANMRRYISNNVVIVPEGDHDVATISNLQPEQSYNVTITAIKGSEQSTMSINIVTTRRYKRPLRALQQITRQDGRSSDEILLRWDRPNVPIRYYEVTYNYTEAGYPVTRRVSQPYIYVPNISLGHSATFRLGYLAQDNRRSPVSIVRISYAANTPPPLADIPGFEEDSEQP